MAFGSLLNQIGLVKRLINFILEFCLNIILNITVFWWIYNEDSSAKWKWIIVLLVVGTFFLKAHYFIQ